MSLTGQQPQRDKDSPPTGQMEPADRRPKGARSGIQAKLPPPKIWLWFLLMIAANYLLVRLLIPGAETLTIPYTVFKEEVGKGNVEAIYSRGETITGRFRAPVTYPPPADQSEAPGRQPQETAQDIDAEVRKIICECHEEAKRMLSKHREQLGALAEALLLRESLNEQEILEVTGLPPAPALKTRLLPVAGVGNRSARLAS